MTQVQTKDPERLIQLAALNGLDSEHPTNLDRQKHLSEQSQEAQEVEIEKVPETDVASEFLLSEEEMENEEDELESTPRTLSTHPLSRIVFVFGGVLGLVALGGLFLSPLRKGFSDKPVNEEPSEEEEAVETFEADNSQGEILSELAHSDQRTQLENLNQPPTQQRQASDENTATSKTATSQSASTRSVPASASSPSPRTYSAPPPRPAVAPPPASLREPPRPVVRESIRTPAAVSRTPLDPTEAWLLAGQLGSYGQAPLPSEANETPPFQDRAEQETPIPKAILTSYQANEPKPIPSLLNNVQPQSSVLVGTKAIALLEDTVVWDNTESAAEQHFLLFLAEPLQAADGTVVFPEGSQLIAKLQSPSESGFVQLKVVSALIEKSGSWQEVPVTENALLIRGGEGEPLVAERQGESNSSGSNRLDGAGLAVDVLSSAGEAFGLEGAGGASRVYDRVFGRSSQSPVSRASQGVWVLESGTEVEVFVNQTFAPSFLNQTPSPQSWSARTEHKKEALAPLAAPPPAEVQSGNETFSLQQAIERSRKRRIRHENAMQNHLRLGEI